MQRSKLILSVLLFITETTTLKAQNATDLFQQALELERSKGDLAGAMQIYQRIVSEFPSDKAVAASALFRLGYSQEKIGQVQARTSYERLVREYADQTVIAEDARARLAALAAAEGAPRNPAIMIADIDPQTGVIHGSALRLTQSNTTIDQYPTWSPDGKSLAFKRTVTDAGQKSTSIIVKRIDSRTEMKGGQQPADPSYWLPDAGGGLASIRGAEIYRDTPEGTSQLLVNLGLMPHDIALAPDGKMLYATLINQNAVFVGSTIVAFDIATGERKRAFSLPAGKAGASDILQFGHYLSVSPDGNKLAVVRWSDERQPHIEWWGVDGKGFGSSAVGPGLVQCLQWTKDGRSVLFARSQDGVRWQILRLGSDDGAPTFTGLEVTALTYFDLSPNGLRIAFDGTSYTLR